MNEHEPLNLEALLALAQREGWQLETDNDGQLIIYTGRDREYQSLD